MFYHWTDSVNLPAPQIHNVSYWNPHVYSLGLPRQSWNKNASSVLYIAIWPQTFCKNPLPFAKRAAMEQACPAPHCRGASLQQTQSSAAIAEPGIHGALSKKKNTRVIPGSIGNDWIKYLVIWNRLTSPRLLVVYNFILYNQRGEKPCSKLEARDKACNYLSFKRGSLSQIFSIKITSIMGCYTGDIHFK